MILQGFTKHLWYYFTLLSSSFSVLISLCPPSPITVPLYVFPIWSQSKKVSYNNSETILVRSNNM